MSPRFSTIIQECLIKFFEPLTAQIHVSLFSSQSEESYSPIQVLPWLDFPHQPYFWWSAPPNCSLPSDHIYPILCFWSCQHLCSQYPSLSFLYQNPSHCLKFSSNHSSIKNCPLVTPKSRTCNYEDKEYRYFLILLKRSTVMCV